MIGDRIGNYEITEKIGEGGVGEVFKAVDVMLERVVAIKFLRRDFASRPEVVDRFRSEARALAQLNHPNIATLYSLEQEDDILAMVMEYVDGRTLTSLLRESGRLSVACAVQVFFQALDGIGFAHDHGMIHRDIKSSNLMLTRSGVVKVMDFGVARFLGVGCVNGDGDVVGTARYMPPEQIQSLETDVHSDIYALGTLLFEMLAGHVPFDFEDRHDVIRAQIEADPPSLRTLVPEVPELVDGAIRCALEKDPSDRFESTREVHEALESLVSEEFDLAGAMELRELARNCEVAEAGPESGRIDDPTLMHLNDDQEPPPSSDDHTLGSHSRALDPTPLEMETSLIESWDPSSALSHTAGEDPADVGKELPPRRSRTSPWAVVALLLAMTAAAVFLHFSDWHAALLSWVPPRGAPPAIPASTVHKADEPRTSAQPARKDARDSRAQRMSPAAAKTVRRKPAARSDDKAADRRQSAGRRRGGKTAVPASPDTAAEESRKDAWIIRRQ
jgi:serine/threonine-protein kinase